MMRLETRDQESRASSGAAAVGSGDPPELIDEPFSFRSRAAPDAAARDAVHRGLGHLAALGDLADERVVEVVDPLLRALGLRWRPGLPEVEHAGLRAAANHF